MNRDSAQSWKAARKNIEGLPERPEDMSEPKYASLMFDERCFASILSCLLYR